MESISVDGVDVRKATQESLHKNIGVVQQDVFLFADSIAENIRYGKLDATMDAIRMKFGNDKITRASIMNSNAGIGRKAKAQMENEENGKGF